MSEEEKRLRQEYKQTRKKWINYQLIAIAAVLLLAMCMTVLSVALNKTYYVNYEEKSKVEYGVTLKDNEFFEGDYLDEDYTYVATLIDEIHTDLKYQIVTDAAESVKFDYKYRVDAVIEIRDAKSGKVLFAPVYNVIEEKSAAKSGTFLTVLEGVDIDYGYYNEIAERFIATYELEGAEAALVLKMPVTMTGESEMFADGKHSFAAEPSLKIPLTKKTVEVEPIVTESEDAKQILSRSTTKAAKVFMILAIVFAVIDLALVVLLICFVQLSKNFDTTYEARLQRLLRNYKSFIQKINNAFDTEGYRVLYVDTFEEMLEIRDTINSPILMNENDDKTCTTFVIAEGQVAYVYELKVEDYDEIYNKVEEIEIEVLPEEEPVVEVEPIIEPEPEPEPEPEIIPEPIVEPEPEPEPEGVEVIGVVWPEGNKDKIYRYDPNGEKLEERDVVLVPTYSGEERGEVEREAEVVLPNHRVAPETLKYPLKKIISVLRRNVQKTIGDHPARSDGE